MFIGQLLVCSMFVGNVDSFVCLIYACVTEFSSSVYICCGHCMKLFYILFIL
jgi:hypothetical protein